MSSLPYGDGKSLRVLKNKATGKLRLLEPSYEVLDNLTDDEYRSLTEVMCDFWRKNYPGQSIRVPRRMKPHEREQYLNELAEADAMVEGRK